MNIQGHLSINLVMLMPAVPCPRQPKDTQQDCYRRDTESRSAPSSHRRVCYRIVLCLCLREERNLRVHGGLSGGHVGVYVDCSRAVKSWTGLADKAWNEWVAGRIELM